VRGMYEELMTTRAWDDHVQLAHGNMWLPVRGSRPYQRLGGLSCRRSSWGPGTQKQTVLKLVDRVGLGCHKHRWVGLAGGPTML
jgi:hypothetical protein